MSENIDKLCLGWSINIEKLQLISLFLSSCLWQMSLPLVFFLKFSTRTEVIAGFACWLLRFSRLSWRSINQRKIINHPLKPFKHIYSQMNQCFRCLVLFAKESTDFYWFKFTYTWSLKLNNKSHVDYEQMSRMQIKKWPWISCKTWNQLRNPFKRFVLFIYTLN